MTKWRAPKVMDSLQCLQKHQLGNKHKDMYREVHQASPDTHLPPSLPAQNAQPQGASAQLQLLPKDHKDYVPYNHFCPLCVKEHSSSAELTQHCSSKSHVHNFQKLRSTDPLRFTRMQITSAAFQCYVCKDVGKKTRFSDERNLQVVSLSSRFAIALNLTATDHCIPSGCICRVSDYFDYTLVLSQLEEYV